LLNAGVNRLAIEGRQWRILGWGDVEHIPAPTAASDDIVP
jgi:probable phosphoglycerate mutase